MRTAVLRYVPRAFSAATLEDVLRPLLCAFATPTLRVVLGWAVLRYGPCAFSATTLEAVLRSVLCALPVPTLRVVLRRAVLRYVSRAFSAATLGLGASFMVVPHGRYVRLLFQVPAPISRHHRNYRRRSDIRVPRAWRLVHQGKDPLQNFHWSIARQSCPPYGRPRRGACQSRAGA